MHIFALAAESYSFTWLVERFIWRCHFQDFFFSVQEYAMKVFPLAPLFIYFFSFDTTMAIIKEILINQCLILHPQIKKKMNFKNIKLVQNMIVFSLTWDVFSLEHHGQTELHQYHSVQSTLMKLLYIDFKLTR